MTAQTTHFDFHAEQLEAFCGTQPRGRALDLSERRKDVTCKKCLRMLADYDQEAGNAEMHNMIADRDDLAEFRAIDVPVVSDIAERNGLTIDAVQAGFDAGWLKR